MNPFLHNALVRITSGEYRNHVGTIVDRPDDYSVVIEVDNYGDVGPDELGVHTDYVKNVTESQEKILDRIKTSPDKEPLRIFEKEDFAFFADMVGVRGDWHEPDEQGVDARVYGYGFDNAGFWGSSKDRYLSFEELHVVFFLHNSPVVAVNLASLCAWGSS